MLRITITAVVTRLLELEEARVDGCGEHLHLAHLLQVHLAVRLNKGEVRLGRHVHVPPVALEELGGAVVDQPVHLAHVQDERIAHLYANVRVSPYALRAYI